MVSIGVDAFIWTEHFSEDELWILRKTKELGFSPLDIPIARPENFPTEKVKEINAEVGLELVTSTTLTEKANIISPDPDIRKNGIKSLKALIDINNTLNAPVLGGVNYAGWGCLSGKSRTEQEWEWSVTAMREVAEYAKETGGVVIAVEPVNRFETHFLNIASDAVQYCQDVGTGNIKVHLDSFHMIREETSFRDAVETCGKDYLGYIHTCENNRGIPGTGLVPWEEFFMALKDIEYTGALVIEAFDPNAEELNSLCGIWRKFAESGEALAVQGKKNLEAIAAKVGYSL